MVVKRAAAKKQSASTEKAFGTVYKQVEIIY